VVPTTTPTAGQSITITGGHTWYFGGEADGVDGVRRKVREMVKLGVDFIKVMGTGGGTIGTISHKPSYTRDELNALADEAHRLDRKITVHCLCAESIEYAIDAGVDQIEHASFIVADGDRITQRYVPEVGEKLAKSGIPVTGTLSVAEYVVRMLSAKEQLTHAEQADLDRWQVMLEDNLNQFRSLYEAGVTFVAGTDAGWRFTPFDALPVELELMQRGGMPTLEAISAGTGRAAAVIGVDGQVGTVREGLEADLIALEGDPPFGQEAGKDLVRFPQTLDWPLRAFERHVVLLEQREVAGAEDELGPTVRQLVEGRNLLRDERRVLEDDPRDLRAQPQARRACRTGCKE